LQTWSQWDLRAQDLSRTFFRMDDHRSNQAAKNHPGLRTTGRPAVLLLERESRKMMAARPRTVLRASAGAAERNCPSPVGQRRKKRGSDDVTLTRRRKLDALMIDARAVRPRTVRCARPDPPHPPPAGGALQSGCEQAFRLLDPIRFERRGLAPTHGDVSPGCFQQISSAPKQAVLRYFSSSARSPWNSEGSAGMKSAGPIFQKYSKQGAPPQQSKRMLAAEPELASASK